MNMQETLAYKDEMQELLDRSARTAEFIRHQLAKADQPAKTEWQGRKYCANHFLDYEEEQCPICIKEQKEREQFEFDLVEYRAQVAGTDRDTLSKRWRGLCQLRSDWERIGYGHRNGGSALARWKVSREIMMIIRILAESD